ncbi:hypothetical protein ACFLRN_08430 [Thermoproteota archaeon]
MLVKKETTISPKILNSLYIFAALIGVLVLLLVLAQVNDSPIPFISGDREAFFALGIIGFTMCSIGMYASGELYGWLDPFRILAIVIGVFNLLLVGSIFFQIELPFITDIETAFLVLAFLILIKFLITNGQRILDLAGKLYD